MASGNKGLGRGFGVYFGDSAGSTKTEKKRAVRKTEDITEKSKEKDGDSAASSAVKKNTAKAGKASPAKGSRASAGDDKVLSENKAAVSESGETAGGDVSRETSSIRISLIQPNPGQPRKVFDEEKLAELAESIAQHGVLQPILVKKSGGMYEIVVGERRWRAARLAGLTEIPAIVKDLDKKGAAEAALIENIQREDLGSVEEARAFQALINEFGLTQEELANRVSKNRSTITNSLRILQLSDSILARIENGELSAGHARALLAINDRELRETAALEIVSRGLSVRQAEQLAKNCNNPAEKKKEKPEDGASAGASAERSMYIEALEKDIASFMNTRVRIKQTGMNRGRIEIEYYSDEELESIAEKLK